MSTPGSPGVDGLGSAAQRDRRRRILAAAADLASAGGFEQVQMRAVAERADVALGTLYRYFPSKIHLLVSVLAAQFERAREAFDRHPVTGATAPDRVMQLLDRATRSLQRDPHLTEALTRAYVFADASVATETSLVDHHVTRLLTAALREPQPEGVATDGASAPTSEEVAITKVIGDVWLVSLVQWVTGRVSTEDVAHSLDVAVRLLLR
jgi:AcrR family transcriptional regulator